MADNQRAIGEDWYVFWQGDLIIAPTGTPGAYGQEFSPGMEWDTVEVTAALDQVRIHRKTKRTIDPTGVVMTPLGTAGSAFRTSIMAGQQGSLVWSLGTAAGDARWGIMAEIKSGFGSNDITYDGETPTNISWFPTDGAMIYEEGDTW